MSNPKVSFGAPELTPVQVTHAHTDTPEASQPVPVQRLLSAPATPMEKERALASFAKQREDPTPNQQARQATFVRLDKGRPHSVFFKYGFRRQQQQGWIARVKGSRAHMLVFSLTFALTTPFLSAGQQYESANAPCGWVPTASCTKSPREYCFQDPGCDAIWYEVQEYPSRAASLVASWIDMPRANRSGCNAGGVNQRCRFCGFGAHAPCPTSAMWLPHSASVVSLVVVWLNWQWRSTSWIGFVTAGYLVLASVYLW